MKNTLHSFPKWFLLGVVFLMSFDARKGENQTIHHPYHVAVFEVNYNAKDTSLEVTCKLISEDLESILRTKSGGAIDLASVPDQEKNRKLINDYISKNLSIRLEGVPVKLEILGFEKEKASVYAYFEAKNLTQPKKIGIKNTVLYDLTKDQAQIVHVVVAGKRQSKKLNYPDNSLEFDF